MIAPQELRLGNLIDKYGKPIEVDLGIWTKINNGSVIYKPIELNQDWLLKFGFEKVDNNNFKLGDYSILITKREIRFIICNYMDIPPSVKLKYVHQLQNLIFALSGEELTIKEQK